MSKSIQIAVDALGINEVGGARSVTLPLLQRVFRQQNQWQFHCFLTQYETDLDFKNVKQIILPLSKGMLSRVAFQFIIPFYVLFKNIDLTHFIKSQGNLLFSSKKILTLYDCTILRFPEYFNTPSRLFWRYVQPAICKHMDRITTISEDAKTEINAYLKVPLEKISVIYPAPQFEEEDLLSGAEIDTVLKNHQLESPYLLYIGQIGMKKNLMTLIQAYELIQKKMPSAPPLILVGPRYYLSDAGEIFSDIESLGLQNKIRYLGPVKREELQVILEHAMMLLFPSVHEGFGIPIAEAMHLGVPVMTSNTSVMPEVVGDAGVLVNDFLSPEDWAENIITLIENPERRKELSKKSLERSKAFSWDISAEKLINHYKNLLEVDTHF
jgi:glycosyltransferase involved in cell wall biosynthesis